MIREEDIEHWKEHGYVIIEKFLSPQELERYRTAWKTHMPDWDEYNTNTPMYKKSFPTGLLRYDFPYANDDLNQLTFHPLLLAFAERIAGSDDLALSLGHLIGKYAGNDDFDQQLHTDMGNNTVVVPRKDNKWIDIPMITYLTDVTLDLGPTAIVSQQHTRHRPVVIDGTAQRPRGKFDELYEKENKLTVPAGSVVIYSMRTFHRGTGVKAKEGCRIVLFHGYHTASCRWMGPMIYNTRIGSREFKQFLEHADPRQREYVGFPAVGSDYWNDEEVLDGVTQKYPGMDMRPYGGPPPRV